MQKYQSPDIQGFDFSKKFISKEVFKNNWVILYFYPRDLTPGCTIEAQDFQNLHEEFENLNTIVVGVSKDSCESHKKFIDKLGLRFLLLSDESGRLAEDFGVWKEKVNYGKRYIGIERSTFIINPAGDIVQEWRKVKTLGHAQKVLETLQDLKKQALKPQR